MWESTRWWQVIKGGGSSEFPSCAFLSRSVPFPGSDPNRSLLISDPNLTIFFIVDDVNRQNEVFVSPNFNSIISDASCYKLSFST